MKKVLPILIAVFIASCVDQGEKEQKALIDTLAVEGHIETLASDEYLGRKPFTEGESKTIEYLRNEFQSYGLDPGNGESYFQEVPLVELTAMPDDQLIVEGGRGETTLNLGDDFVAFTEKVEEEVIMEDSELVFAGYGVVAPEYDWNDYEGLDVKGKTVIVLVNDPGFGSGDSTFFKGETMTYYGRWTYKYEEAARQGAAGVIIVHETVPAGYPWLVVRNSWSGASLYLDTTDPDSYKCKVQGWITRDAAIQLFEQSEVDMRNFVKRAREEDFQAIPLGLRTSLIIRNKIKRDQSQNVIAKITGTERPDEAVIYTAHWDHLGVGPEVEGDSIYNGAHDNASGTAILLAIAEAMSKKEKPERSVVFLAVTAEEQGLLGSKHYAENPLFEPDKTVANINMDGVAYYGEMRDFTVVGYGQSELDDLAGEIAESQGRYVKPDPDPGKGYFFRSDHFNFAKIGVPAMFASGSYEAIDGGVERIARLSDDYLSNKYHRPADEINDSWLFGGVLQDAELFYRLGWELANSDQWPKWKAGSEFKSIREK